MPVEILTATILEPTRQPPHDHGPPRAGRFVVVMATLTAALATSLGFNAGLLAATVRPPATAARPAATDPPRAAPAVPAVSATHPTPSPAVAVPDPPREDWVLQDALQYRGDLSRWSSARQAAIPPIRLRSLNRCAS